MAAEVSSLIATGSTEPVFLAINAAESLNPRQPKRGLKGFAVCRGRDQLMDFILRDMPVGMVTTSLELTHAAHRLAANLDQTQPSRRGPWIFGAVAKKDEWSAAIF